MRLVHPDGRGENAFIQYLSELDAAISRAVDGRLLYQGTPNGTIYTAETRTMVTTASAAGAGNLDVWIIPPGSSRDASTLVWSGNVSGSQDLPIAHTVPAGGAIDAIGAVTLTVSGRVAQ